MAKPVKRSNGTWGIQIKVGDVRDSGSFPTAREANEWAAVRKLELKSIGSGNAGQVKTLEEAFNKFKEEVSPTHEGTRWEVLRINAFLRHPELPIKLPLNKTLPDHIIAWRDSRLKEVAASSVLREMNLMGSMFTHAVKEWRWIKTNPVHEVSRPSAPKHRERTLSRSEIKQMLRGLGYSPHKPPKTLTAMVGYAMLIALRTGMRDGEITNLTWDRVRPSWVTLPKTKNGDARNVPMSKKTRRLIDRLRGIDS